MIKELKINCEGTVRSIVESLKREAENQRKNRAILGLSGGIDSAVVAFLCKKAGLDLFAIMLPSKNSRDDPSKYARFVASALDLDKNRVFVIPVLPSAVYQLKELKRQLKMPPEDNAEDNARVIARQRYMILSYLARRFNAMLVGTKQLTEYWLGLFFIRQDITFDINPISHLWKTQVYQLAKYLNVPSEIVKREPTSCVWPDKTAENVFGFSHEVADPILHLYVYRKYSSRKIAKKLGFDPELTKKIIARVEESSYKRQEPPRDYWFPNY